MDKYMRARMEQACREEQREAAEKMVAEWRDYLVALAKARLHERWGDPSVQSDMQILRRYGRTSTVKGANVCVSMDGTDSFHWETDGFGLTFDSDLLLPGDNRPEYPEISIRLDDPEWPRLRGMVLTRKDYAARQRQEFIAFHAFIRSTQSERKLYAALPWLAARMGVASPT